jgi:hypothetical protein
MGNLEPLSPDEERAALHIAASDARLRPLLNARNAPILVRPTERDRHQPEEARQALIGFYDYERDQTIMAVVDLGTGEVVTVEESPVQLQLSAEEEREAAQLAGRDARVERMLAGRPMQPLTRLYFPPWAGRDVPPHRYAIVFVRPNSRERAFAVVDLTEQLVVEVLRPNQLTVQ